MFNVQCVAEFVATEGEIIAWVSIGWFCSPNSNFFSVFFFLSIPTVSSCCSLQFKQSVRNAMNAHGTQIDEASIILFDENSRTITANELKHFSSMKSISNLKKFKEIKCLWLELQLWLLLNLSNAQWSMHLLTYLSSKHVLYLQRDRNIDFVSSRCQYNLPCMALRLL